MRYRVCKVIKEAYADKEDQFVNPYNPAKRVWHLGFETAKIEAERLCLEYGNEYSIISEIARIKPAPKILFEDYREE